MEKNLQSWPFLHLPAIVVEQRISAPGECTCLQDSNQGHRSLVREKLWENRRSTGLRHLLLANLSFGYQDWGIIVEYSIILFFSLESKGKGCLGFSGAWKSPGERHPLEIPQALRQPGLGLGLSHKQGLTLGIKTLGKISSQVEIRSLVSQLLRHIYTKYYKFYQKGRNIRKGKPII